MTNKLIRRSFPAYRTSQEDPAIALRLDHTEPPIPFRESIGNDSSAAAWSRYPSAISLEAIIARQFQTRPENVIVTAGADEALDRACRAVLSQGDELLTTTPTFEMIAKYGALASANVSKILWMAGEFPIKEFTECISERTRLIVLVSPNNPTGQCIPIDALTQIAVQNPSIPIVLDLAYVEFADSDPTDRLLQFPNIVIVRSFSKAWGLPGLRLGYAVGNAQIIQAMRAAGGPYSVAASSIQTMFANFDRFRQEMLAYRERIKRERQDLETWLAEAEVHYIPSQANFILIFPENGKSFDKALRAFGIQARSFKDDELSNARRLTLPGNAEAFALLLIALESAFQFQPLPS